MPRKKTLLVNDPLAWGPGESDQEITTSIVDEGPCVANVEGDAKATDMETIKLDGKLGISEVAELRQLLMDSLKNKKAITIDLAEVNAIDTAGAQFLLAAIEYAVSDGFKLGIAGISPGVDQSLRLIGIAEIVSQASEKMQVRV